MHPCSYAEASGASVFVTAPRSKEKARPAAARRIERTVHRPFLGRVHPDTARRIRGENQALETVFRASGPHGHAPGRPGTPSGNYSPPPCASTATRFEMPHSAARIWALMQDYPRWTEYAPMVLAVEVIHPGDAGGNGLLRRVIYRMPFGRRGSAYRAGAERRAGARLHLHDALARARQRPDPGAVRLEPLGPARTRLHFEERSTWRARRGAGSRGGSTRSSTARTSARCGRSRSG